MRLPSSWVLPDGEFENQEGATASLLKEATALCSVNHPHIVTVFDAGIDDDGPYVVMELLSGRTLDEMIERATLTAEDFREVAIQSQEALIAAQDLDIVHRDLKPTNVMVTWLPSGKFQVKLVDFGLAKFTPKPSVQTIDHGDAVFGSIHFMAPEQFERTPLDKRTDMYAMGCLYYYCLTGRFPFDGETAPQVMAAHLQHSVTPLQELRPDVPAWMNEWVMWHINRNMDDRPVDARQSLEHWLNCEVQGQSMPIPEPTQPAESITQPEDLHPPDLNETPHGRRSGPVSTITAPQTILPPEGRPSIHTSAHRIKATQLHPLQQTPTPDSKPSPAPVMENTPSPDTPKKPVLLTGAVSAQPAETPAAPTTPAPSATAAPPEAPTPAPPASKPVLLAGTNPPPATTPAPPPTSPAAQAPSTVQLTGAAVPPPPPAPPAEKSDAVISSVVPNQQKKKGMSNALKGVIAAALTICLIIGGIIIFNRVNENKKTEALNAIMTRFEKGPSEMELNKLEVRRLLEEASALGKKKERETFFEILRVATPSDSTNIDEDVAKYATSDADISPEVRRKFFQVLSMRKSPDALPELLEYAKSGAPQSKEALAVIGKLSTPENFGDLLGIVRDSSDDNVLRAAERATTNAINSSEDPSKFASKLVSTYELATRDSAKHAYLRLMGLTGSKEVVELIKENFKSEDLTAKASAISALAQWPDRSQFETLHNFCMDQEEGSLHYQAFNALIDLIKNTSASEEHPDEELWNKVADAAISEDEICGKLLRELANIKEEWALTIIKRFQGDDQEDKVIDTADKAYERLKARLKTN